MPETLDTLIAQLDAVLAELSSAVSSHEDEIGAAGPKRRLGATNLVAYAALRQQDIRELQSHLMDLGVTSLATSEANVQAKVQAARNVLAALRGDPGPWDLGAIADALDEGDALLEAHALALFGSPRPAHPNRIMVTLPSEAVDAPELVAAFVEAGMDIARVNCAHDGPAAWEKMIGHVRTAAAAAGREVMISMDVAGPKLRTGPIADGAAVGRARVVRDPTGQMIAPSRLWLVGSDEPARPVPSRAASGRAALTVRVDPGWLARCHLGEVISLADTRGLRRQFRVVLCEPGGVLAEGQRSAYIADGTMLDCAGQTTAAGGIPRLARRLTLAAGDELVLTSDLTPVEPPDAGQPARIGCTLPEAVAAMRVGELVRLDDATIDAVVESIRAGEVTLRITRTKPGGQHLGAEKGINLPDTQLPLPALTVEDKSYLPFIAAHADLIAVSFIRSVADIDDILASLAAIDAEHLGLILKIETSMGFQQLPSILLAAMRHERLGVMIARGDLAVEVGFERLSEVPRQILALCEAAHVPAIWATQVLESLAKTGQPSRAEITDAAAAQRADCVMLNKGPHIPETIHTLDDILERMAEVQRKSRTLMRRIHSWDGQ